jgi:signal transduction histidine kinase
VVQRIAERLGGKVEVRSEIGVGSTFSFTLPVPD